MIDNQNEKSSLRKKWIYAFIILAVVLLYTSWNEYLKSLPQDYTIGEITRIYLPGKGNRKAVFSYSVSGKGYDGEISVNRFPSKPEVGLHFVVEYPERFGGKFGVLRPDIPIIRPVEIPVKGWDELPKELKGIKNN